MRALLFHGSILLQIFVGILVSRSNLLRATGSTSESTALKDKQSRDEHFCTPSHSRRSHLPIPNHQRQLRHQLSCPVLVRLCVCRLDDLHHPFVRLSEEQREGELSLSEQCASMLLGQSLEEGGGTDASTRFPRWSST